MTAGHGAGPFEVEQVRIALDDERGELPVDLLLPVAAAPYPLVVFSHGAGAATRYSGLARHWATNGIASALPVHADALERLLPGLGLHAGEVERLREEPRALELLGRGGVRAGLERAADLVTVIEQLADATPSFVDTQRVGVAGHSYGALAAALAAGATIVDEHGGQRGVAASRISALLLLSGPGTGAHGLTEASWRTVTVPMLCVSGSQDRGPDGQPHSWRQEAYRLAGSSRRWLVDVDGADHGLGGIAADQRVESLAWEAVATASAAFWLCTLMANRAACAWLDRHARR